jgi:hypothetical protein
MTQANTAKQIPDSGDTAPAAAETTAPTLQVQDLQNLLQIVDYAADQGAFKGWTTISQVFAVRQKLHAFLQSVAPKTEDAAAETEPEDGTEQNAVEKSSKVTKMPKKKK